MTRMRILLLPLLLTVCRSDAQWRLPFPASDTAGCETKYRAAQARVPSDRNDDRLSRFDVTYYKLSLSVLPATSSLSGSVTLRGLVLADTLSEVTLDLSSSMVIDSVVFQQQSVPFIRYPRSFSVSLLQPFRRGDSITITVSYRGSPIPTGFGSFAFSSFDNLPWVWSLSQPYGAPDWWPCIDHPLDKADSVDVWITSPAGLKVGSNGRLLEVRNNGDGTWTHKWSERYPIATYLVSVAIANYAEFTNWYKYSPTDSMQILNYVLPARLPEAQQVLPKTVDMLRIFSRLYGPYPFINEKYGHSEFGRGGAMEHQTMTSTTTYNEDVIAHELAHQWFGDMITCATWQHLWLNEGFATYNEALYREQQYGPSEYWRLIRNRLTSALNAQGSLFVRDTSTVAELFAVSRVYAKGASVLHMLRHVVGDTLFFRSLRAYAGDLRFRYGTATTEGFQEVCEQVTGKNLSTFFAQWVYGESYPRYFVTWSAQAEGSRYRVDLRLRQETQTTDPQFFIMPIDCRVSGGGADTLVTLTNDSPVQDFSFTVGFSPDQLEVDPEGWILREVFDENPPLPEHVVLDQNYPNPFNPGTTIEFQIPHRSPVTLSVYNTLGQLVNQLLNGRLEAGKHTVEWRGTSDAGVPVPSGVYFYRLEADGARRVRRMILLK